jgi:hypothetical protein
MGLFWNSNETLPNISTQTDSPVGLAVYPAPTPNSGTQSWNPGVLYMAYKGKGNGTIYWARSNDGTTWNTNEIAKIPNSPSTNCGPCLVTFQGNMHLFYTGANDGTIYSAYYDGTKWNGNLAVNVPDGSGGNTTMNTDKAPTACTFMQGTTEVLMLCYKAKNSSSIWYATFDGTSWTNQLIPGSSAATSAPPSVTNLNNVVSLVFKNNGTSEIIWAHWSDNGQGTWSWIVNGPLDGIGGTQTDQRPVFGISGTFLYILYKSGTDNDLWWAKKAYNNEWGLNEEIPGIGDPKSNKGLASINYMGVMYLIYVGTNSSIYWAQYS